MTIRDLKPALIWEIFDEITKVPRPSKKEEKIRQFLLDFAAKHDVPVKIIPLTLKITRSQPSWTANGFMPTAPHLALITASAWLPHWP